MARKGILTSNTDAPAPAPRREREKPSMPPRGAVGALQTSLSKLQENAVQDLDANRIHDAGVTDRLGQDHEANEALKESLRTYGQQVPVLVRPKDGSNGEYEIVYGRRRLAALKALGMPVKAMVRHLDDQALVLAQGQENTARKDLSFVERASFAAQLEVLNYDRQTIAAALSIDMPMLSRLLKVGRSFSVEFLRHIGSAPGIGRDRWLKLSKAMESARIRERVEARLPALIGIDDSDARFEQVIAWATEQASPPVVKPAKPPARTIKSDAGYDLARLKRTATDLQLSIPLGDAPDFADWVEASADDLVQDLYSRWIASRASKTQ